MTGSFSEEITPVLAADGDDPGIEKVVPDFWGRMGWGDTRSAHRHADLWGLFGVKGPLGLWWLSVQLGCSPAHSPGSCSAPGVALLRGFGVKRVPTRCRIQKLPVSGQRWHLLLSWERYHEKVGRKVGGWTMMRKGDGERRSWGKEGTEETGCPPVLPGPCQPASQPARAALGPDKGPLCGQDAPWTQHLRVCLSRTSTSKQPGT